MQVTGEWCAMPAEKKGIPLCRYDASYVTAFIDRVTRFGQGAFTTVLHSRYSEFALNLWSTRIIKK